MVVELPGELTIAHAAELREFLSAVAGREDVQLNTRAVAEVDVAGLQLLCAAHRTALASNRRFVLAEGPVSPELRKAIETAGFGRNPDDRWLLGETEDA